jgi:SAM-dependent methyltransferase
MDKKSPGQWPEVAFIWSQIGPPLRPSDEDISFLIRLLNEQGSARPISALVLGVTPELYRLPWPAGSNVSAIDRTQAMIDHVWPGPAESVTHADWLELPFHASSMDLVLCDGGLHLLNYPEQQQEIASRLAHIIKPEGYCVFRLFLPPAIKETPEAVLADLQQGNIPNLNCLKLRLGAALQQGPTQGVELNEVWKTLHEAEPDLNTLAMTLGWTSDHISAIHAYRGSAARYHFVTVDEAIALFCEATDGAFEVYRLEFPDYPMGELCPTIMFKRRD